jgi:hypothetical protein
MIRFHRHQSHPDLSELPKISPKEKAEVQEELRKSEMRFLEISRRWPEVMGVVNSLIEIRRENNFQAKIRNALTGENP